MTWGKLAEAVARANNFIMTIPVKGDNVHEVSWLLKELPEVYKWLQEAAKEAKEAGEAEVAENTEEVETEEESA